MPRLQQQITVSSQNQAIGHRSPRVADQSPEHSTQKHTDTNSPDMRRIDHRPSCIIVTVLLLAPPFEHDNRRGACVYSQNLSDVGWLAGPIVLDACTIWLFLLPQ